MEFFICCPATMFTGCDTFEQFPFPQSGYLVFQNHQRSRGVHRWEKSRRRRNRIKSGFFWRQTSWYLPISLSGSGRLRQLFSLLPSSSPTLHPRAVNLISEALFDSQLKQTRGTEQRDLVKAFGSHPVWPSGVGAPGRSHSADYLCRL